MKTFSASVDTSGFSYLAYWYDELHRLIFMCWNSLTFLRLYPLGCNVLSFFFFFFMRQFLLKPPFYQTPHYTNITFSSHHENSARRYMRTHILKVRKQIQVGQDIQARVRIQTKPNPSWPFPPVLPTGSMLQVKGTICKTSGLTAEVLTFPS